MRGTLAMSGTRAKELRIVYFTKLGIHGSPCGQGSTFDFAIDFIAVLLSVRPVFTTGFDMAQESAVDILRPKLDE